MLYITIWMYYLFVIEIVQKIRKVGSDAAAIYNHICLLIRYVLIRIGCNRNWHPYYICFGVREYWLDSIYIQIIEYRIHYK